MNLNFQPDRLRERIAFSLLQVGDVFKYRGRACMKVKGCQIRGRGYRYYNAVILTTGTVICIRDRNQAVTKLPLNYYED